jgi:hypothetical protein
LSIEINSKQKGHVKQDVPNKNVKIFMYRKLLLTFLVLLLLTTIYVVYVDVVLRLSGQSSKSLEKVNTNNSESLIKLLDADDRLEEKRILCDQMPSDLSKT